MPHHISDSSLGIHGGCLQPYINLLVIHWISLILTRASDTMLVLILLFVLILCYLVKQWLRIRAMDKSVADLPTFPSQPIIGHFHLIASKDPKQFFQNVLEYTFKIEDTFKLWLGPWLMVFVQEKDDLKAVFQCVSKPLFYQFAPEAIRNSLVAMTDGVLDYSVIAWQIYN